jgi:hypothetical protein
MPAVYKYFYMKCLIKLDQGCIKKIRPKVNMSIILAYRGGSKAGGPLALVQLVHQWNMARMMRKKKRWRKRRKWREIEEKKRSALPAILFCIHQC